MADGLILSIDGMGGDSAPDIVIEGIDIAAGRRQGVRYLVHGDAERISALLQRYRRAAAVVDVAPAEKAIGMEVKPSQALRQGRGSSLWNAVAAVENGQAHAVVSAGNTGALMAIAMFRLRMMQGVRVPPGFTIGLDHERDAKRFHVTENGVVVVPNNAVMVGD